MVNCKSDKKNCALEHDLVVAGEAEVDNSVVNNLNKQHTAECATDCTGAATEGNATENSCRHSIKVGGQCLDVRGRTHLLLASPEDTCQNVHSTSVDEEDCLCLADVDTCKTSSDGITTDHVCVTAESCELHDKSVDDEQCASDEEQYGDVLVKDCSLSNVQEAYAVDHNVVSSCPQCCETCVDGAETKGCDEGHQVEKLACANDDETEAAAAEKSDNKSYAPGKTVDFAELKEYAEKWNTLYTESTFWFDIGFVAFALLIVVVVLLEALQSEFESLNLMLRISP